MGAPPMPDCHSSQSGTLHQAPWIGPVLSCGSVGAWERSVRLGSSGFAPPAENDAASDRFSCSALTEAEAKSDSSAQI